MAALIVAGVTALGFTQSGIAAGSIAAWMMSVTGPVASGSLVAVCQSIGATGAVSATTAAIANSTAAAVVGGVALKTVRVIKRRLQGDNPPSTETTDRGAPVASPNSDEEEDSTTDSDNEQGSVKLDLISAECTYER